jgi:hypothetical protein
VLAFFSFYFVRSSRVCGYATHKPLVQSQSDNIKRVHRCQTIIKAPNVQIKGVSTFGVDFVIFFLNILNKHLLHLRASFWSNGKTINQEKTVWQFKETTTTKCINDKQKRCPTNQIL